MKDKEMNEWLKKWTENKELLSVETFGKIVTLYKATDFVEPNKVRVEVSWASIGGTTTDVADEFVTNLHRAINRANEVKVLLENKGFTVI